MPSDDEKEQVAAASTRKEDKGGDDDSGEEEEESEEEEDGDDLGDSGPDDDDEDEEMSESGDDPREAKATSKAAASSAADGGSDHKQAAPERSLRNQPFDVALDLSESESNASEHGHDSPKKAGGAGGSSLKNMPFDEALELSMTQDMDSPVKKPRATSAASDAGGGAKAAMETPPYTTIGGTSTASATTKDATAASLAASLGGEIKNRPFDEEMDLSDSGDSVDTNEAPSPDSKTSLKAKASATPSTTVPATVQEQAKEREREKEPPRIIASSTPTPAPKMDDKPPAAMQATTAKPASVPVTRAQDEKKAPPPAATRKKSEESDESAESGSEEEEEEEESEDEEEEDQEQESSPARGRAEAASSAGGSSGTAMSAVNSTAQAAMLANAGAYKESDFANLKVGKDIKDLFLHIGRFKPQDIELETKLKCFIPEYIPAVGEMDAFLKPARPDGEADSLGLKTLDEPSLSQSDATVLDLQLRSTSKKKHGDLIVRSLENAEKTPKEIDKWIRSIAELHRTKPPPQVHYTKPMPDIESLMQVWPDEVEDVLAKLVLPSADIDLTLEQYIRVICAILDVPVHKNVYESLHVLFTLYLEFCNNQHFMNYDERFGGNPLGNGMLSDAPPESAMNNRKDDDAFARTPIEVDDDRPLRK